MLHAWSVESEVRSIVSELDYEEILRRVNKMARLIDKAEEDARGSEWRHWRRPYDLRLAVHRLQRDTRGEQSPEEPPGDASGT